jgi:hypothetical protein
MDSPTITVLLGTKNQIQLRSLDFQQNLHVF